MELLFEIIHRDRFIIEDGSHSRDAMILVLEGKFSWSLDGTENLASPGDICVFPANVQFSRKVLQPLRCIYLQFEPYPTAMEAGSLTPVDPLRAANTISHLEQAVLAGNRQLTEHLIWDLILLSRQKSEADGPKDATVSRCIEYFARHRQERITLDMLSVRYNLSKQALIRKFKAQTGKTPMEYLSAIRVDLGKQLLKDSALPITEIATRCGFENVYYFSNHFKHATGLSPTGYRKLMDL